MKVRDLILLLQTQDQEAHVATHLSWNSDVTEAHEFSHGPLWVGPKAGRVYVGIDLSSKDRSPLRTCRDGHIMTVLEYYDQRHSG
jgi:hypothetical protein